MKFETTRENLQAALRRVKGCIAPRTTLPILANVLIHVDNNGVVFKGCNLDKQVSQEMEAEVAEPGALTVPFQILDAFVGKLPKGAEIKVSSDKDSTLVVKSGRSRITLNTLGAEDFPDLQAGEMPIRFVVPGDVMRCLIERTQFAISSEETRYYLNGIYLHATARDNAPDKRVLRAVATDGHRLAQSDAELPNGAEKMPGVIIPRDTVKEILDLCGPDALLEISLSHTKIAVAAGTTHLVSKLIDGTFPDYGRVIPRGNNCIAIVDRKDLITMVDRVSTVSSERGRAVKFSFDTGKLTLGISNPDGGSAQDETEVDYDAPEMSIGFNSRYMIDVLENIDDPKARFELADAGSPTLVRAPGDENNLVVLMPMRV